MNARTHEHRTPNESEFNCGDLMRCECGQWFWLAGMARPFSWWPISGRTARKAQRAGAVVPS